MGTLRKTDAILLNIKINRPKLVNVCRYKLVKFHGNIHNQSENIAKSFRGLLMAVIFRYIDSDGLFSAYQVTNPVKSSNVIYELRMHIASSPRRHSLTLQ